MKIKYFLLPIVILLSFPTFTMAQSDTVTLLISSVPMDICYEVRTVGTSPYRHCDSAKITTIERYLIFDKILRQNSMIEFGHDYEDVNGNISYDRMRIWYDSLSHNIDSITFSLSFSSALGTYITSKNEQISMKNVRVHRNGRNLTGRLTGMEIPTHSFTFKGLYSTAQHHTGGYDFTYDTMKFAGAQDFSSVSFTISSMAFLDITMSKLLPSTMKIYPNPAASSVTVTSSQDNGPIYISDILGKTVRLLNPFDGSTNTDISDLPNGVYCVHDNRKTQRLIISH